MGFSETFAFPEAAFNDFLAIHDNICGDPTLENKDALPEWFRVEYGIRRASDIKKLYNTWDWYELDVLTYDESSGKMEIGGEGTGNEYALETIWVCELLNRVMNHYGIPGVITIREDPGLNTELLENGHGGIVYAISRDYYRKLTTDWLAEQMRLEKI